MFMLYFDIFFDYKIRKPSEHQYLNGMNNYLQQLGFFLMTAWQQRNNRALPIFIKFLRSLNDKRVNKFSSRISSGISIILFCIEFDIMTIKLYDCNLIKSLERLENHLIFIIINKSNVLFQGLKFW